MCPKFDVTGNLENFWDLNWALITTHDSLDRAPIELVGVATASRCCHRAGTEPPLRESDATVKLTIPVKS